MILDARLQQSRVLCDALLLQNNTKRRSQQLSGVAQIMCHTYKSEKFYILLMVLYGRQTYDQ